MIYRSIYTPIYLTSNKCKDFANQTDGLIFGDGAAQTNWASVRSGQALLACLRGVSIGVLCLLPIEQLCPTLDIGLSTVCLHQQPRPPYAFPDDSLSIHTLTPAQAQGRPTLTTLKQTQDILNVHFTYTQRSMHTSKRTRSMKCLGTLQHVNGKQNGRKLVRVMGKVCSVNRYHYQVVSYVRLYLIQWESIVSRQLYTASQICDLTPFREFLPSRWCLVESPRH